MIQFKLAPVPKVIANDSVVCDELVGDAIVAVRNAFYEDFSQLANLYAAAAAGLGEYVEDDLSEQANWYSRRDPVSMDVKPVHLMLSDQTQIDCASVIEALTLSASHTVDCSVMMGSRILLRRTAGVWAPDTAVG